MIQCKQNCDPQLASPEKHLVKKISETVLTDHKVQDGDISFIFGSDELLASLKKEFFQQDHWTDVIAFRLNDYKETHVEGEIYISLPRAKENAEEFGESFEKEVARLIVHGTLHLLGFEDETEKQKDTMRKTEEKYLNLVDWELLFGE